MEQVLTRVLKYFLLDLLRESMEQNLEKSSKEGPNKSKALPAGIRDRTIGETSG